MGGKCFAHPAVMFGGGYAAHCMSVVVACKAFIPRLVFRRITLDLFEGLSMLVRT